MEIYPNPIVGNIFQLIPDVFDKGLDTSVKPSKPIEFSPNDASFSILCEVNCKELTARGNRILCNRDREMVDLN